MEKIFFSNKDEKLINDFKNNLIKNVFGKKYLNLQENFINYTFYNYIQSQYRTITNFDVVQIVYKEKFYKENETEKDKKRKESLFMSKFYISINENDNNTYYIKNKLIHNIVFEFKLLHKQVKLYRIFIKNEDGYEIIKNTHKGLVKAIHKEGN